MALHPKELANALMRIPSRSRCVHLTGAEKLFKELTEVQITNICNYFSLVLTSTAEQARDSSVELTIPSHSAESCAVIPTGDLRAVSTADESEVFTLGVLSMIV